MVSFQKELVGNLLIDQIIIDIWASPIDTPNLPTNIIPTGIAWVKLSGKSPLGLGTPPLKIKIMLESNPLKSKMLVGRLGVARDSAAVLLKSWRPVLPRLISIHVPHIAPGRPSGRTRGRWRLINSSITIVINNHNYKLFSAQHTLFD